MTELLKSSYRLSMTYSILFIIIGASLFIDPAGFVVLVSYLIGVLLLVAGVNNVISYSKNRDLSVSKTLLVFGIILFIMGIFLIARPTFIGKIVPSIIGVCLIISSIEKLLYLNYLNDKNSDNYIISLISGIVILLAGIFLLFNPLAGTLIATQIIGVLIMIYAIMDIIEKIRFKKGFRNIKKNIEKDAKIIDER